MEISRMLIWVQTFCSEYVSGVCGIKLLLSLEKILFGFSLDNVKEVFILLDDLASFFRRYLNFVCFLELTQLILVIRWNVIVGGDCCTYCVFQLMKSDEKAQVDNLSGLLRISYASEF